MRRPTILFINRVYPPVRGATGRLLRDLARAFAREGWHVTIVTSGPVPGELRRDGIKIISVKGAEKPSSILSYAFIWLKMFIVAMRLQRRHVLVTLSDPPLLVYAGHLIAKFKKCRHINWCQDLYPEVMPAIGVNLPAFLMRFLTKLRRKAMNHCDRVIVSGRCMAKFLSEDGLDAQKIAFVPNWPDHELTDPEMIDSVIKIDEAQVPEIVRPFDQQLKTAQKFRVLYSGTLGRAHPVDTFMRAAKMLHEAESDIEFVFVGEGQKFDAIAAYRTTHNLDNIRLLPSQPIEQLREVLEGGDVHLITLADDAAGFVVPSKLYASLAVARPCIMVGPKTSETAKVIRDFNAGLIVRQGDAKNLVRAIMSFRENGEAWFSAHHGAVHAREAFMPHDSLEAWMDRVWDVVKGDLA